MNFFKVVILLILSFSLNVLACNKDHTAKECPLAGDIKSKTYYLPQSKLYKKMLKKPKVANAEDHRACFQTQEEAEKLGFNQAKK